MRSILFWIIIFSIKPYLYYRIYKISKQGFFRKLGILIAILSILSVFIGVYCAFTSFSMGISRLNFQSNFFIALMASFFICECIVLPFFIVEDLFYWGNSLRLKYFKKEEENKDSRRNFLKKTGSILGAGLLGSFAHGITLGKYNYKVKNIPLDFEDLPPAFDGFRILQFSDLHAGSLDDFDKVKKGIQLIQEQKADLILFTGDLVNSYATEVDPFIKSFSELEAPFGKFSVLGNHDYSMYGRMFDSESHKLSNAEKIKENHAKMGFNLLMNTNYTLQKENDKIFICGVENWGRSRHFPKLGDLDLATQDIDERDFVVLMSHDPTHWDEKVKKYSKKIHLTLSGHTHGLQMGIDLPVFKWSPIKYVYKHWAGLYEEAQRKLYVNRGFGFLGFAGRVGVYPEITVLELRRKLS